MRRISTATKSIDLFGAGKHGFTGGNGPGGIPPTQLEAPWFNAVQEALCNPIEHVGATIDGSDNAQLTKAIYRIGRSWTPDLIGSFDTAITVRTHANGDERDTWLHRKLTTTALNVASGTNTFLGFLPADATHFSGNVMTTYCRVGVSNQTGAFHARFSGYRTGGTTNITLATTTHDDGMTGALLQIDLDGTGQFGVLAVFDAVPAGEWNISATFEWQIVTRFNP